ncbi:MAG: threonine/serine exporter family protein [Faecalibacterium sp.]|nr:threonine/serine exporter family protein [Ruminococcus sp.]MCM1393256.1 threonine/serine exporter family protein [Ruminococcus sp.]MCM1486716.1 threonine/serine exporter family protein [Faecalibacterium sp.]
MDIKEALTIIISGIVGTTGFALLFRIQHKKIIFAAIGGGLTCVVYVISCVYFSHEFFQNLFPALAATAYAEILARIIKTPATPFVACSILPMVPGGKLYYTMYYFITNNMDDFRTALMQTLRIAAGLAVGIILVSVIIREINYNKFKQIYEME